MCCSGIRKGRRCCGGRCQISATVPPSRKTAFADVCANAASAAMASTRPVIIAITRRSLLRCAGLAGAGLAAGGVLPARVFAQAGAPAIITSERTRPRLPCGVQSGDLAGDRAIIWARADRPARMMVEWATTESFRERAPGARPGRRSRTAISPRRSISRVCRPASACSTASRMVDLTDHKLTSEPVTGSFWTPPAAAARHPLRLVGRYRRAGLGHQSRLGRHEDLRDHAPGRARVLHPLGRHDLRRRADRGRAGHARTAASGGT